MHINFKPLLLNLFVFLRILLVANENTMYLTLTAALFPSAHAHLFTLATERSWAFS